MMKIHNIVVLAAVALFSLAAGAAEIWWGNPNQNPTGGDGNWSNFSNWGGLVLPGAADSACINTNGIPYPMLSAGNYVVNDLLDGYWQDGGMTINGGQLGVKNLVAVGYKGGNWNGPANNAILTMNDGYLGSLTVTDNIPQQLWVGYSVDAFYKINGTLNMNGGRIDVRWSLNVGGGAGNTVGHLNLAGGEINLWQTLNVAAGSNLDIGSGGTLKLWNKGGGKTRTQIDAMITGGLITGNGITRNVRITEFANGAGGTGFALAAGAMVKKVSYPSPEDGESDINRAVTLSWTSAAGVISHNLYFGSDFNAVKDATPATPIIYKTNLPYGNESYAVSGLDFSQKYYWRVDEITSSGIQKGDVFEFRVEPFPIIEDFEKYAGTPQVRDVWSDGNSNTSLVLSRDILGRCLLVNYGPNQIVKRSFSAVEDFSGKEYLNLMLKGQAANSDDMITVVLKDNNQQTAAKILFRYSGLKKTTWKTYSLALNSFTGIDLHSIQEITLVFSDSPASGSNTGQVYIDEITLTDEKRYLDADLDGDGIVELSDLAFISSGWLDSETVSVQEPQDALVRYNFDDGAGMTAVDSSGNGNNGALTAAGSWFSTGGHDGGGYINFNGSFEVGIPNAASVFTSVGTQMSISFWVNTPAATVRDWNPIFHATKSGVNRIVMANIPTPVTPPQLMCSMGADIAQNFVCDTLWWTFPDSSYYYNSWNHYVFTKDSVAGVIKIYRNGSLVAQQTNSFYPMGGITQFAIGGMSDNSARSKCKMDDFRVYGRVLTLTEILALNGSTGNIQQPLSDPRVDLMPDGVINLCDMAVLAGQWLQEKKPAVWFDAQFLKYDETSMLEALQGIVNRDGPRLLLNRPGWDSSPDGQWVDIYSQRNGVQFKSDITRLQNLLSYFSGYYNGFVVYDPNVDGSRYVAMTMAGIYNVLPVSPSILNGYCADLILSQSQKWGGVDFKNGTKEQIRSGWGLPYGAWDCNHLFTAGVGLKTRNVYVNTQSTSASFTTYGPVVVDLAAYPILEVKIGSVSSGTSWEIYLTHDNDGDGNENVVYLGGASSTGTFTYNVASQIGSSSSQVLNRILLKTNGTAGEVTWQSLRFKNVSSVYAPILTPNTITSITAKPVMYDLRGQFANTLAAYQWMISYLAPLADRKFAHTVNAPVDGVCTGGGPWDNMNFAIMKRGLIFNLSFNYSDTYAFGVDYVGVPAQADMYRNILTTLDHPALVTGYGDSENDWFPLMNEYGHRYNANQYNNMSFHAAVPPRKPYLRQKKHFRPSNTVVDPNKYYVCFLNSDGDSMKNVVTQHYQSWNADPKRGTLAFSVSVPTDLGESCPALLEYFFDTATDNDYIAPTRCMFLNASSGIGNPLYDRMGQELETGDFDVMPSVVIDSPISGKAGYADYLKRLGVMGSAEIKWSGTESQQIVTLTDGTIVPSVTCHGWLGYSNRALDSGNWDAPQWTELYADQGTWNAKVQQFVSFIDNIANSHQPPFVIIVFPSVHCEGIQYTMHKDIADALDPQKFKVTRLDEAMAAIKKHNE